jgi:triacylglycerol lipase
MDLILNLAQQYIGLGTPRNTNLKMMEPTVPIPSSIISFIDSPAYSNLTSTYMEEEFNPNVPDIPSVKYWSVAARTNTMSFFHPLWLPKLVVDSFQEKQREQLRDSVQSSRTDWGNDGLVTVESAKWGDFLGILEECDHWEVRGAGGFNGHAEWKSEAERRSKWSWGDWQSFLGDWRRGREDEKATHREANTQTEKEATKILSKEKQDLVKNPRAMYAVLDWVVDNVPGVNAMQSPLKMVVEKAFPLTPKNGHNKPEPPKFDIERFYVALCRKLYDEGM